MRLTPSFFKVRARVGFSILFAILFVSSIAEGFEAGNKAAIHQWNAKFEEGTQAISQGTKMKVTIGRKQIVCRSKSRHEIHLVVIPAARVKQISYETEYHSLASMAMGDNFESVISGCDSPICMIMAAPMYGFLSLFDHPRRLVKITWLSKDNEESFLVLRVRKADYSSILEMLESSTGKKSVDLWTEREKEIQNYWNNDPVPRDPIDVAGDKTLQKSLDETIQGDSATASVRLRRAVDSAHGAPFEEKPTPIGLCAVLAPDSDSYSVNCRLRDKEIPRERMPSLPTARQLNSLQSEAAPAGPR